MASSRRAIPFSDPRIEKEEIREVLKCLHSGWLTTGPRVQLFQKNFKQYMKVAHAIALDSCTSGLFLSLKVAGIKAGDEVMTTPLTYAATAHSIIHCGAKPVFVDIDPKTMNMDPEQIAEKVTRRTKAIIPVHFAGRPCEMDAILRIARKKKLFVIQDAAHALEAKYHGKRIGQLGDSTCFSFYATKNLTTGEGGMLTTSRKAWADQIQLLAYQGMTRGAWRRYSNAGKYQILEAGYKANMMDLQAAMGVQQLKKIERFLKVRERLWKAYDRGLQNLPLETPAKPQARTRHARHLYTVRLHLKALKVSRDRFQQELFKKGIGTSVHFISLHLQPYYSKRLKLRKKDFPNASKHSESILSLPLSAKMSGQDVKRVVGTVEKTFKKFQR